MISKGVQPPELIVDGVTKDPDGLISAFPGNEHLKDISPVQASNGLITIDHLVIPIDKVIF